VITLRAQRHEEGYLVQLSRVTTNPAVADADVAAARVAFETVEDPEMGVVTLLVGTGVHPEVGDLAGLVVEAADVDADANAETLATTVTM